MPRTEYLLLLLAGLFLLVLNSILCESLPISGRKGRSSRRRHSGRLLGRPNPGKCVRRPKQILDKASGHYYFFSDDTKYKVRINQIRAIISRTLS